MEDNAFVGIPSVEYYAVRDVQLESIGLTHFQYEKGDTLGMVLAFSSLIPIFLIVAEATIVLSRREVAGILLFVGQLLNELFNKVLKDVIKQERPNKHLGDGYGMPSSHAQFMCFFAVYVCIYLQKHVKTNWMHKQMVQFGAIGLCFPIIGSRVYLGYHTTEQVLMGSGVGILSGLFWYVVVDRLVYPSRIVDVVLDTALCRWLYIRDSRSVVDIARAEYKLSSLPTKTHKE